MKRYYDMLVEFTIKTVNDEFSLAFSSDWKFKEMLDYMVDTYSIPDDEIFEISCNFIRRYKILEK